MTVADKTVETTDTRVMRVMLYGAEAHLLIPEIGHHTNLEIVTDEPDVIICYGGDGTLLHAELEWPGRPKVPVLHSQRGYRCIPHPPSQVIAGLAQGRLLRNFYTKLDCTVFRGQAGSQHFNALNEVNVHMGRINSAVRFDLSINGQPFEEGREILGDGFVVCTPFGSTAYFSAITHVVFYEGIGVAFKATNEHINNMVLPESYTVRLRITRGPAVLAHDSALAYVQLRAGDELEVKKHKQSATILTCDPVRRPDEPF